MAIETWSPDTEPESSEAFDLAKLLNIALLDNRDATVFHLTDEQINWLQPLMKQSKNFWHNHCSELPIETLKSLIYFFTLSEEKYSVLEAGNDSPVIAFNKILKEKKSPLSKEDLLWIKENSRNKFLPNGSIF